MGIVGTRRLSSAFGFAAASFLWLMATGCVDENPAGFALFLSPQSNPLALSNDGRMLYVANTTSGAVSMVDVASPSLPQEIAEIPVGLDPVSVAVRPTPSGQDELVLVSNHISDSISVISRNKRDVVDTIQAVDASGVSTTNEPVGIAFAGSNRAFVALDNSNEVLVLDFVSGRFAVNSKRLKISAQAPRALAVAGNRLFVAAFESENQTEFPSCAPGDSRRLDEQNDLDEGCEFKLSVVTFDFGVPTTGPLADFVQNPNIGGRVIRDRGRPDRDLFIYNTSSLSLEKVISGVGTLLYGVAAHSNGTTTRVYVTNTEARNQLDGLAALGNRMFENRLSYIDCTAAGCSDTPVHVDLDGPSSEGERRGFAVPIPYGVAVDSNRTVVALTAAGSDGKARTETGTPAGQRELPGVVTLNASGALLGGARVGAIPQGIAMGTFFAGADVPPNRFAFVLNTVESTLTSVDVTAADRPQIRGTLSIGSDPTPSAVKQGRIAFNSARASTSGTFACESCHPNGNMDQLIWTINTVSGPGGRDPNNAHAEPRTTMPIRGLRDTIPLHWDGTLADPIAGAFVPGDSAPDCDLANGGQEGCVRHLVDASLQGVMCKQVSGCPSGAVPNRNGALTVAERDAMATFLLAVAFPPSPSRAPSDQLSTQAVAGVEDFFTDQGGAGNLVRQADTCSDSQGGCHALPLTVSTNSPSVGRFDAPSIRGLWDRFVVFSNGLVSSEEALVLGQQCSNGVGPVDPCNPLSPIGFPIAPIREQVYDSAVGMTERGSLMATFAYVFSLVYGVRGPEIWQYINEMSVGLPGLTGRQISLPPRSSIPASDLTQLTQVENAVRDGKIAAVARNAKLGAHRFDGSRWKRTFQGGTESLTVQQLQALGFQNGETFTVTAELPAQLVGGGTFQPLIGADPVTVGSSSGSFRVVSRHVDPQAKVMIDGAVCPSCTLALQIGAGGQGADLLDLGYSGLDTRGMHVMQVLNPKGWASNELPVYRN